MILSKKQRNISIAVFAVIIALLLFGIIISGRSPNEAEPIKEVMKDAVLHESGKINLFGKIEVNPGLISAYAVTAVLIVFAAAVRIFAIPKFKDEPGKFQYLLEKGVGLFTGMAQENSPHKPDFVGAYIFAAGVYIFFGTLFELFGFQAVTTAGRSIALPAPLADINGAIAMGFLSYGVILEFQSRTVLPYEFCILPQNRILRLLHYTNERFFIKCAESCDDRESPNQFRYKSVSHYILRKSLLEKLVAFLDEAGAETFKRLLAVPRAAVRGAEPRYDVRDFVKIMSVQNFQIPLKNFYNFTA